jgi:predicted ATP-dependent endonuclease of OLD family
MRLKQIELTNFRSIDGAVFELDGKSTVNKE